MKIEIFYNDKKVCVISDTEEQKPLDEDEKYFKDANEERQMWRRRFLDNLEIDCTVKEKNIFMSLPCAYFLGADDPYTVFEKCCRF